MISYIEKAEDILYRFLAEPPQTKINLKYLFAGYVQYLFDSFDDEINIYFNFLRMNDIEEVDVSGSYGSFEIGIDIIYQEKEKLFSIEEWKELKENIMFIFAHELKHFDQYEQREHFVQRDSYYNEIEQITDMNFIGFENPDEIDANSFALAYRIFRKYENTDFCDVINNREIQGFLDILKEDSKLKRKMYKKIYKFLYNFKQEETNNENIQRIYQ